MIHLASWQALFEGRGVLIAPLPPPISNPGTVSSRLYLRILAVVIGMAIAIGAGYALWSASGRWWIGFMVFCIFAWVALIFAWGIFSAVRLARADQKRRYERAMADPITRLLPHRGLRRNQILQCDRYKELFALSPRPVMLFDEAFVHAAGADEMVGSLAPRGHLPEPEALASSSVRPGGALGAAVLALQGVRFFVEGITSLFSGAGLSWQGGVGLLMLATAILIIFSDPWARRKLGLPKLFSVDAEIGAGWIRTVNGELFRAQDSIVLLTLEGSCVEVRCIRPDKVDSFFLPILYRSKRKTFAALKPPSKLGRALRGAKEDFKAAMGGADASVRPEMPTDADPFRLLLSSWTYPEPRVDLAPTKLD